MKAVILEIRDGYAAVLREDGTVEKLRRDGRVGETIELEERAQITRFPGRAAKWTAAAAAAVVLLSAGGAWGFNNAYAYSYVTLDANPSIEYVLNRKNRVIAVEALNEDGEAIAAELSDVKRQSLTEAVEATTDILYEQLYLTGDDDSILVNVTSRGEAQQEALTQELDDYFSAREEAGELTVYMTNATRDERERADELDMSAGRYMLLRDAEAREDGQDADRFRDEPVERLLEETGRRPAAPTAAPTVPGPQAEGSEPLGADGAGEPTDESGAREAGPTVPEQNGPDGGAGGPSGEPSRG